MVLSLTLPSVHSRFGSSNLGLFSGAQIFWKRNMVFALEKLNKCVWWHATYKAGT